MITHTVLVKLADKSQLSFAADQLRTLATSDGVHSLTVGENLELTPTTWDIVVVSQHQTLDDLHAFRVEEYHKEVGKKIAQFVESSATVDFDSGDTVTVA